MRLLQYSGPGGYRLTEPFQPNEAIPSYAILSHTWREEGDEVTYHDLVSGTGTEKPGYEKIRFCAAQAKRNGLAYFWIDTCCINKENKAELSYALKSMFRWYRDASRCYVYLADVSTAKRDKDGNISNWELPFRNSRWFTRGWTLQELIAPRIVEFFSRQSKLIGDKYTLQQQLHEITGIPKAALIGKHLSQFSIHDRFSWIEDRKTKLEEDKAYALMGILDLSIPPLYGEGAARAFQRLQDERSKIDKCMQDLHITDPEHDKARIEQMKGGLLEDLYHWILQNPDFRRWQEESQSRLLWIKGDPGKGKTMLLCGVINELNKFFTAESTVLLGYFFCQATDSRSNTATAVLRGLLFMLARQQPSLITRLREKHDKIGKALFENANAWVALSEIFTNILQDPSLQITYFVIDALDECITDRSKLLDFIIKTSSITSRTKWVISSRNWPDIEQILERADKVRLSLELNAESVSTAVRSYIDHRVSRLALEKKCSNETKRDILSYLYDNANDTFLWASLVCQSMDKMTRFNMVRKLKAYPPGLDSLYQRMLRHINESDDVDLCKHVLAIVTIVYRPITLQELTSLVEELDDVAENLDLIREVVSLCGSFLTVRDGIIYFVHHSAKDFLIKEPGHNIFSSGNEQVHYIIFSRSLRAMSSTLRRDIYDLCDWGCSIEQVQTPEPDPLAVVRYSCIYWIDHLCDWISRISPQTNDSCQDGSAIDRFFGKHYLNWLEALSLCKSMSKGLLSMAKLEALVNRTTVASSLTEVVRDARRHIMYYKSVIESHPLQTYTSALIFSPSDSLIKKRFNEEVPREIIIKPRTRNRWSSCHQTLEGHSEGVCSVAFSHDSSLLASGCYDLTVKIWDTKSGSCLQTLKGHRRAINAVSFSHDSTLLASASSDLTIKIWDTGSWKSLQTLRGHYARVNSVAFSRNPTRLISVALDRTIKYWNPYSGKCTKTIAYLDDVSQLVLSHDSSRLALASTYTWSSNIKVWHASSGECLHTLDGHSAVAFSHNADRLVSASHGNLLKIWDVSSGICLQVLEGHGTTINAVAFSPDSKLLASGAGEHKIRIWDSGSGQCVQTLDGHTGSISSIAFSRGSAQLASGSYDGMVKLWDFHHSDILQEEEDDNVVSCMVSSYNSSRLALFSRSVITIWDANTNKCLQTLSTRDRAAVSSAAFSSDSSQLVSGSRDGTIEVWHLGSSECLWTVKEHSSSIGCVTFSYDSAWVASGLEAYSDRRGSRVKIWDAKHGNCLQTFAAPSPVAFAPDSSHVAFQAYNYTIEIRNLISRECIWRFQCHSMIATLAFSSDSALLASSSLDETISLWDIDSGRCFQAFHVGRPVYRIMFSADHSCLRTEIGTIRIGEPSRSRLLSAEPEAEAPQYQGLSLSVDLAWIRLGQKKLIWIPPEYRSSDAVVSEDSVYVAGGPMGFWMWKLQL